MKVFSVMVFDGKKKVGEFSFDSYSLKGKTPLEKAWAIAGILYTGNFFLKVS